MARLHAKTWLPCVFLLFITLIGNTRGARKRPHIVVLLADDLGWSDVGYRDSEMHTPNIDKLASEGVQLNYSYMQQVCTPSRAAFLSGYYPFKMGLQHSVFTALRNNSMPLGYRFLSEHLHDSGYGTHYVGKWHLGFCNLRMTPTYRGFDTFYGMYNGKAGYFNHVGKWNGYDLQDNTGKGADRNFTVDWSGNGTYSTHLFTDRAVKIIEDHNQSKPLFLFLSYQAVHGPLEVPESYVTDFCSDVTVGGRDRKLHCAMTAAMDEGIGKVMKALNEMGMSDDVITLFISDNGGPTKLASSNWPLRGSKITLWEGGTRVVTILHSKTHLPNAPYTWNGLMHAVDWYPTLARAAGNTSGIATDVDGVDNWESIVNQGDSKRHEFVYNINDVKKSEGIRVGNWKLVKKAGKPDGWFNPPAGQVGRTAPRRRRGSKYMLFDIANDPEEVYDISKEYPDVVSNLTAKLERHKENLQPSTIAKKIPAGKPNRHEGAWVSGWC